MTTIFRSWARTDIMANFELPLDTWLSWNTRSVTLNPIYDETWRERIAPEMQPEHDGLNLVANIKDCLLRLLAQHGSICFTARDVDIQTGTYRAMAELVAARLAEDAEGTHGELILLVKPAGLDAAAKLGVER